MQDRPEWRLIPAIYLTALVHCPGGAAPTGYPGYYPQDEAHLAYYLESTREAASFTRYLQDHVWGKRRVISGTSLLRTSHETALA